MLALGMPKFLKWLIIIAVVSIVGFFALGILAALFLPNVARFQHKARQTEAKSNLTAGFTISKMAFLDEAKYPSDPLVVFKDTFACESESRCLRYVYAIRRSCESNASEPFSIADNGVQFLRTDLVSRLPEIKSYLQKLEVPCKPEKKGFTLVAVGESADHSLEVWKLDETKNLDLIPSYVR